MKALVTGATGFVGSHLVRDLLARGVEVRVLARKTSPWKNLENLSVERAEGDVRDADSLARAMRGCEAVFHAAAQYTFWEADPRSYYDINLEGTKNVLRACEKSKVKRLVYTSTIATVGGARSPDALLNESATYNLDETKDHYILSKKQAETEVLKATQEGRLDAVIVNPGGPIGARDLKPTPTGFLLMKFINGEVPV
ncbi:MAG: NAD-dependent epimerase/dehydratase family protein, partial [Bdellovibrionota bacterium]